MSPFWDEIAEPRRKHEEKQARRDLYGCLKGQM
jgi:hypothetical protein